MGEEAHLFLSTFAPGKCSAVMPCTSRIPTISRQVRRFSISRELHTKVRVRFAPSPTGNIHLGGLRTALYNYLFAKKFNGKFILRIEDTDQSRTVPGSIEDIQDSLDWAGLVRHEGPREGGPHGPYLQSERVDLYRRKAQELLQSGRAYRCFCSPARLDLIRKQQARNREPPHYDGKCRHLSATEIDEKMGESEGRFVLRFAMSPGAMQFKDIIYGSIDYKFDPNVDSDPIILKSDGFPTYHLANVVDDHYMEISHVLRGSEWISSTGKHLALYRAFNWDPPCFAHFPLITMRDGSKMSKRNNQSMVKFWIDEGYRPLAMVNFLTNMAGGLPKSKQDSHELWNLNQIAENYNFDQISCHPASIDLNRLRIFNSKDLQHSWKLNPELITREFKSLLRNNSMETDMEDSRLLETIGSFITRIDTLKDLISTEYAFIWNPPELDWQKEPYIEAGWDLKSIVCDIVDFVSNSKHLDKESLEGGLKLISQNHNVEWSALFRLVRKLLTNHDKGLPVHELVRYLGRQRTLARLRSGLKFVIS